MARFIVFIFCIAFLLIGSWTKAGMALAVLGALLLGLYLMYLLLSVFIGPAPQRRD